MFVNTYLYIYVYVVVSKGTPTTPVVPPKGVSTIKNHQNSLVHWLLDPPQGVSAIKNQRNGPNRWFNCLITLYVVRNYSHKNDHIGLRHDVHNMAAIKQSSPKLAYFISNSKSREIQKATAWTSRAFTLKATAFTSKATARAVTPFTSKATARATLPIKATAKAIPPFKAEFESILARKFKLPKRSSKAAITARKFKAPK